MKKKITQTEAIFYKLYNEHTDSNGQPSRFIPVFEFMGEHYVSELDKWGYVSYECSARLSEMTRDNPQLIARQIIVGKSGAKYYGYRMADDACRDFIKDTKLREFYDTVRRRRIAEKMAADRP